MELDELRDGELLMDRTVVQVDREDDRIVSDARQSAHHAPAGCAWPQRRASDTSRIISLLRADDRKRDDIRVAAARGFGDGVLLGARLVGITLERGLVTASENPNVAVGRIPRQNRSSDSETPIAKCLVATEEGRNGERCSETKVEIVVGEHRLLFVQYIRHGKPPFAASAEQTNLSNFFVAVKYNTKPDC